MEEFLGSFMFQIIESDPLFKVSILQVSHCRSSKAGQAVWIIHEDWLQTEYEILEMDILNLFVTKRKWGEYLNLYLMEYCWRTNITFYDHKPDQLGNVQDMARMTSSPD